MAIVVGFNDKAAAAISIIGGADGPTSIFLCGKLGQTEYMGPIAVAAYSYMSLVPIIQPPIMKLLTTKKEREIKMEQLSCYKIGEDSIPNYRNYCGCTYSSFYCTINWYAYVR